MVKFISAETPDFPTAAKILACLLKTPGYIQVRFAFSRFSDFKICFIRCSSDSIGDSSISNVYNDNCDKKMTAIIKNKKIYYNVKLAILEKRQDDTDYYTPLLLIKMVN